MNLQKVKGKHDVVCCQCGQRTNDAYADLDGNAYRDYYCMDCMDELGIV